MRLWHELVYQAVTDICYDREYAYLSFLRVFESLSKQIYTGGGTAARGQAEVSGIKSDYDAVFVWELQRRISFFGKNEFKLACTISDRSTGAEIKHIYGIFDVSTGEEIENVETESMKGVSHDV